MYKIETTFFILLLALGMVVAIVFSKNEALYFLTMKEKSHHLVHENKDISVDSVSFDRIFKEEIRRFSTLIDKEF